MFFFAIRTRTLEKSAVSLREEEAKELVRKLATSPEFAWTKDCSACVDFDKVMMLKEIDSYRDFWNLDYLAIEKIYPKESEECTRANYPECNKVVLIEEQDYGITSEAFIALCRWDGAGRYSRCELGKLYVAGRGIR